MVTVSPSARKPRVDAVGQLDRLGAVPGQFEERADLVAGRARRPCRRRRGRRSAPTRRSRSGGRAAAPASSTCPGTAARRPACRSSPPPAAGRSRTRPAAGSRAAPGPAPAAAHAASASSGTTHGEIEVANDLARNGPSGWYSQAWMSRADQSLTSTTPKTCSAKSVVGIRAARARRPRSRPRPRCPAARSARRRPRGAARTGGRSGCRRPPPCRTGRGSRSAGAASSAAAAGRSGRRIRADVGGVVLGGVEVGVVGDLERQVQPDVAPAGCAARRGCRA